MSSVSDMAFTLAKDVPTGRVTQLGDSAGGRPCRCWPLIHTSRRSDSTVSTERRQGATGRERGDRRVSAYALGRLQTGTGRWEIEGRLRLEDTSMRSLALGVVFVAFNTSVLAGCGSFSLSDGAFSADAGVNGPVRDGASFSGPASADFQLLAFSDWHGQLDPLVE